MRNAKEHWLRRDNTFKPLVSRTLFLEAQKLRRRRGSFRFTEEQLLGPLRALFEREGRLSEPLIAAQTDMPDYKNYQRRYGSLYNAYALVGYYRPLTGPTWGSPALVERAKAFAKQVRHMLKGSGARIRDQGRPEWIVVDKRIKLATALSGYHSSTRDKFWEVSINRAFELDYVLVGLLRPDGRCVCAYYLLPLWRFPSSGTIRILDGGHRLEPYRVPDLATLYQVLLQREASHPGEKSGPAPARNGTPIARAPS